MIWYRFTRRARPTAHPTTSETLFGPGPVFMDATQFSRLRDACRLEGWQWEEVPVAEAIVSCQLLEHGLVLTDPIDVCLFFSLHH